VNPSSTKRGPGRRWFRKVVFRVVLVALIGVAVYLPVRHHRQREEAARLERTRDQLRQDLARLLGEDPRLAEAPPGGVLIGAPAPFTSRLVHQLADGLLQQTEIRLAHLRVRKQGRVNVNTFLGGMTPGTYALDVRVNGIRGKLKVGEPEIHYESHLAHVSVPVTIREGRGRAIIRFQWESKGLAALACGDVDVTERVDGRVVPRTYPVEGAVELSLEESHVKGVPRFPDFTIRLYVEPSKASWRAIDRLLQSQGLRCRTALKLVDVPKALRGVLARGFKVKIPSRKLRPFRLPAGLRDSLVFDGTTYALTVEPRGLKAVQDILWYGADLTARVHPDAAHSSTIADRPAASPVPLPEEPARLPAEGGDLGAEDRSATPGSLEDR
jgi:hypothetical protein